VFGEKQSGLIVDYVGVFRNLQKALAIYGGGAGGGEKPIRNKAELAEELKAQLNGTVEFCREHDVDVLALVPLEGFERIARMKDAREALLVSEDVKKRFLAMVGLLRRLYKAVLPDPAASAYAPGVSTLSALADMIRAVAQPVSVDEVMGEVERLLDRSIAAEPFVIRPTRPEYAGVDRIDLSQIDFGLLREKFNSNHKRTQVERLKAAVGQKVEDMVRLNRTRIDYLEKFQEMIAEYNAGSKNVELFFDELLAFAKKLSQEDQRAVAENLTEEELAVFDLLMKPRPDLADSEVKEVKVIAKELLDTLKREKLVIDWRKRQQSRAAVLITVQDVLDRLPRAYSKETYASKCEAVYQHVFEAYAGAGKSVYEDRAA
jgi:type I restriction enzyme, R subunit